MPVSKKRKPKAKSGKTPTGAKQAIYFKGRVERTEDGRGLYFFPTDEPDEFDKRYRMLSFAEKMAWEKRILDKTPGSDSLLLRFDSGPVPIAVAFWIDLIECHPREFATWCINKIGEFRERKFCITPGGYLTAANAFAYNWASGRITGMSRNGHLMEFAAKLYSAGYDLNIDEIMSCLPDGASLREELSGWKVSVDEARMDSELPPAGGEQDATLKERPSGPSL